MKKKSKAPYDWPEIKLGDPDSDGVVSPKNTELLLSLVRDALQSQLDGVRKIFDRLGIILAQATTLVTAALAGVYWVINNPFQGSGWLAIGLGLSAVCWFFSAGHAAFGMICTTFSAPGIHPEDGYKQEVLGIDERQMQLWAVETLAATFNEGRGKSDSLKYWLKCSIILLVCAPALTPIVVMFHEIGLLIK